MMCVFRAHISLDVAMSSMVLHPFGSSTDPSFEPPCGTRQEHRVLSVPAVPATVQHVVSAESPVGVHLCSSNNRWGTW